MRSSIRALRPRSRCKGREKVQAKGQASTRRFAGNEFGKAWARVAASPPARSTRYGSTDEQVRFRNRELPRRVEPPLKQPLPTGLSMRQSKRTGLLPRGLTAV